MNHRMRNPLCRYKDKCNDRKHNLKHLRSSSLCRDSLHAPLGGRPRTERTNPPDDIQIDQRPNGRGNHHGNADRISMEAARRCMNANRCLSERTQPNGNSNTADRDHGSASTLQHNKNQTRRTNQPSRLAYRTLRQHWHRIRQAIFLTVHPSHGIDAHPGCREPHVQLRVNARISSANSGHRPQSPTRSPSS